MVLKLNSEATLRFLMAFCLWLLLLCPLDSMAKPREQTRRVMLRPEVSALRRRELVAQLRAISGWPELSFDQDGVMVPGEKEANGGSPLARRLLDKALSGSNVVIIEDASNRSDVVFCRVIPAVWRPHPEVPSFVVLIDFSDFARVMGDRPAREAFNAGWGLLHELDHVANDSTDPLTPGVAGECEDRINAMRRECGLPVRADYFFELFPHVNDSDFRTTLVRMRFDREDPRQHHRPLWLMWDAALVGGVEQMARNGNVSR